MNQKQYEKLQKAKELLEEKYRDRKYWKNEIEKLKDDKRIIALKSNAEDTEIEIEALEGYISVGESTLEERVEKEN